MIYKIIKQTPLFQFIIQELHILFILISIYVFICFCLFIYLMIDEYREEKNGNKKDEYT